MATKTDWAAAADYCLYKQAGIADTLRGTWQQIAAWADKNPELAGSLLGAGTGALTTNSLRGTVLGGLAGAGLGYGYRNTLGATLSDKWKTIADKIAPTFQREVENPMKQELSAAKKDTSTDVVNPLKPEENVQ